MLERFWKSATRQWNRFYVMEMTRMNWPEISKIADGCGSCCLRYQFKPLWCICHSDIHFGSTLDGKGSMIDQRLGRSWLNSEKRTSDDQDRAKVRIARHFNAGDRLEMWMNDTKVRPLGVPQSPRMCWAHENAGSKGRLAERSRVGLRQPAQVWYLGAAQED